jgi:hypothetical protein
MVVTVFSLWNLEGGGGLCDLADVASIGSAIKRLNSKPISNTLHGCRTAEQKSIEKCADLDWKASRYPVVR